MRTLTDVIVVVVVVYCCKMNAQEWKSGHFTLDVSAVSATPWLPMQQPSAANKRSFVAIVQGKWILGRCENSCTNKFTSAVFDVAPNSCRSSNVEQEPASLPVGGITFADCMANERTIAI
ncbi:conserved hypothetical protein [Trichinella spiralis]|uniref:hypothetical protein n=1 Tax=Trichinella spiralis TaxID=6334 RepID=UPI0001EFE897|nr:conserved hypothetical protein [Trichinella spiralis]